MIGRTTSLERAKSPCPHRLSIGAEKPISEIVDYREIAIGMPVVEKMELLLSPEPGKSSQP